MRAGDFSGALPAAAARGPAAAGSGAVRPYEAYANCNLGFTLIELGRCDESLPYLDVANRLEDNKDVDKAIRRAGKCAGDGEGDGDD